MQLDSIASGQSLIPLSKSILYLWFNSGKFYGANV